MRHLYAVLTTAACLAVSFVVYAFMCRLFGHRLTLAGFTFALVVSLMFQFCDAEFKRKDKEE